MQPAQPGGREFNIPAAMRAISGANMATDEWGNDRGVAQFGAMGASPGVTSTATYLTASSIK